MLNYIPAKQIKEKWFNSLGRQRQNGKLLILWKHNEKNFDLRNDEQKETKGMTTKEVEEQRQGNLEEIGADWEQAYDGERWKEIVLETKSVRYS